MRLPTDLSVSLLLSRMTEDALFVVLIGAAFAGHSYALAGLPAYLFIRLNGAGIAGAQRAVKGMKQARTSFLERTHEFDLKRLSPNDFISSKMMDEIQFRPSFARPSFKGMFRLNVLPFRLFQLIRKGRGILPREWRAYPAVSTTQFIFVTDDPKRMTTHAKFRLFHELQHVSISSAGEATSRSLEIILLPILGYFCWSIYRHGALTPQLSIWLFALFGLYVCWEVFYAKVLSIFLSELRADEFGIAHLANHEERLEALGTTTRLWAKHITAKETPVRQKIEWRLRLAAMRRAVARAQNHNKTSLIWKYIRRLDYNSALGLRAFFESNQGVLEIDYGTYGKYLLPIVSLTVVVTVWAFRAGFFYLSYQMVSFPSELIGVLIFFVILTTIVANLNIHKSIDEYKKIEEILISKNLAALPNRSKKKKKPKSFAKKIGLMLKGKFER